MASQQPSSWRVIPTRHPCVLRSTKHAASPVGERVEVQASVAYVDGRLVRFSVAASNVSDGKVVGTGEVTRVVVDRGRFL